MKSYITEAANREIITTNPYAVFKIQPARYKEPVFLTSEEVKKISVLKKLNEKTEKTRDLFKAYICHLPYK